jgi:NADH:ubiquinone oxidoreductase subunit 5 (subunit L)/multisubunit Na+/H+ antiporter MnhA subunit
VLRQLAAPVLLLAVTAPVVGAAATQLRSGRTGRRAAVATALGLLAAVVVLAAAALDESARWVVDGRLLVEADRLGALLLVFVLGSALVVQSFAVRSLRGDLQRHRFFVASSLAAAATAVVVVAADLWVLVLAWTAVSVATALLLRHDGRPTSQAASRAALRSFAVGDVALLAAAIVASVAIGPVTLRPEPLAVTAADSSLVGPVGVVALLALAVVLAAVTRCAIPPAQSWLPMSVAAPTPSSAVLHAGIVNGGGVLLIRTAPVLGVSRVATGAAVLAGCAGVLVGGAVARTRPDVKTGLAWSTVAQMGFMVVQCVTGLIGPALVHMVAHGMYKANLFLGSGSTLAHTHPARMPATGAWPRRVLTATVTVVAVGTAWLVVRPSSFSGAAGLVFAGFVAATVAQAAGAWLRTRPRRTVLDLAAALALVVATIAAVAVAAGLKTWLAPSLPEIDPALGTAGAIALAVTGVVAVLLAAAAQHRHGRLAPLVDRAYLWCSHLGDPGRLAPVMRTQEVRP